MTVTGTFRADPIKTTFVGEQLYLEAFNLLRPASIEHVALSGTFGK